MTIAKTLQNRLKNHHCPATRIIVVAIGFGLLVFGGAILFKILCKSNQFLIAQMLGLHHVGLVEPWETTF